MHKYVYNHATIFGNETIIYISYTYGKFLYSFHIYKTLFHQGGFICANGMLYNNISHLPITFILVVNYKYSNMHNTFPESRNISMYTSWTTRYIGNDNSNTYLCFFGRLHLDLCLLELLESLPNVFNFIVWFWGPIPIFLMVENTEQVFLHHRSHRTVSMCPTNVPLLIQWWNG